MANEEHLKILKQGVDDWNKWREENPEIIPDLSGVTLIEANLVGANLTFVNLDSSNLHGANLNGVDLRSATLGHAGLMDIQLNNANLEGASLGMANLRGADLKGANLRETYLRGALFQGADLTEVDLIESHMRSVVFDGAILNEADLSNSFVVFTTFADVDLSKVKGLESVNHNGPSTIGIDTIYKSRGKIPEVFLRRAGVPEEFIEYASHLISGKAIQFYSCFISYSTRDQEFADRLHADLQSKGVRVWFAPEDIKGGRKLHEQIPEAIRLYDKLLLVLSENSMQSEWVKTEIYHARQDEIRDKKRKLFPISLVEFSKIRDWTAFDADVGKDMAREIREYYIPNFSNWKDHDSYKKAFDRLLRDLNLSEK